MFLTVLVNVGVSLLLLNLTLLLRNTARKAVLLLVIINDSNCGCLLLSPQHVDVALAWNLFVSTVRRSFLHENPWPGRTGVCGLGYKIE